MDNLKITSLTYNYDREVCDLYIYTLRFFCFIFVTDGNSRDFQTPLVKTRTFKINLNKNFANIYIFDITSTEPLVNFQSIFKKFQCSGILLKINQFIKPCFAAAR